MYVYSYNMRLVSHSSLEVYILFVLTENQRLKRQANKPDLSRHK